MHMICICMSYDIKALYSLLKVPTAGGKIALRGPVLIHSMLQSAQLCMNTRMHLF